VDIRNQLKRSPKTSENLIKPGPETTSGDWSHNRGMRNFKNHILHAVALGCTAGICLVLLYLSWSMFEKGYDTLTLDFLNNFSSRTAARSGIKAGIYGSFYLAGLTALIAIPLGIGTAVFLEEYMPESAFKKIIDINIANLAGIPSIIYGMLGLALFVRILGFGGSILSGALTMSLLILPVIVVASREALKNVPVSIRHAAYALGAEKWQTVRAHVLPAAAPGIMTGIILAMARALGETAPLILVGAVTYIAFVPEGPMDSFTVMPLQIYNWTSRPQESFQSIAASGIIVLMALILVSNALAVFIRYRGEKLKKW
jgi:phosphate transport system permease protein